MAWKPGPAYVGRHRAPRPARPVAPLAVTLAPVQVQCEAVFVALRHIGDDRTIDDSWALAEIDAHDLRTATAVAR